MQVAGHRPTLARVASEPTRRGEGLHAVWRPMASGDGQDGEQSCGQGTDQNVATNLVHSFLNRMARNLQVNFGHAIPHAHSLLHQTRPEYLKSLGGNAL